ncbi:MMPL family transporter [Promicromonospora sp. NPDC023805]|uniref:MMPL family transporter n=1 Tax=Promicromonospora sp. NPDC023805 TaxID=3154696 RepID=UPI0033E75854
MFNHIAALATRRPRLLLAVAGVLIALCGVLGSGVESRLGAGGVTDPSAESSLVAAAVEDHAPQAAPDVVLLVTAPEDVASPGVAAPGLRLTERLAETPGVEGVSSYWRTPVSALRSEDGRHAIVAARVAGDEQAVNEAVAAIQDQFAGERDGLDVAVIGPGAVYAELQATIREDLARAELIVLPITLVILLVVFGGFLAAGLPLAVGLASVMGTNAILMGLTLFTDVSVFSINLTTALGLGLAIDYALLVVRRFREELVATDDVATAVHNTVGSAGRTVLYSAITVAAALSSLLIFPLYFLRSFAYAGVAVVALSALAALLVLPAVLTLLGDRLRPGRSWLSRRRRATAPPTTPATPPPAPAAGGASGGLTVGAWASWTRGVMRHRWVVALTVGAGLLILALPFRGVAFGEADFRQLAEDSPVRAAQQLLRDEFTSGGESMATLMLPAGSDTDDIDAVRDAVLRIDGIDDVEPVPGTGASVSTVVGDLVVPAPGDYPVLLTVTADADIPLASARAQEMAREIRALPEAENFSVGGQPATLVDSQDSIGSLLPIALAIAIGSALIIVFLLTGSVVLPLQAVLANGLSLTAMLGAIVWVFQDGNLAGLLGFTPTGYIDTTVPVLMACVAFGLSMDYGVFLLARTVEEHRRTGDLQEAVATAMQRTGGVITAAALILATVLIAIGSSRIANTQMLGFGVALAVLVDATIVRTTLVPAFMALTGRWTWWAPGPLRRLHARIGWHEEGPAPVVAPATAAGTRHETPSDRVPVLATTAEER